MYIGFIFGLVQIELPKIPFLSQAGMGMQFRKRFRTSKIGFLRLSNSFGRFDMQNWTKFWKFISQSSLSKSKTNVIGVKSKSSMRFCYEYEKILIIDYKIKKIHRNVEPGSQQGQIQLRFPCGTRNDSIIACKLHPESPSHNGIPCCLASI